MLASLKPAPSDRDPADESAEPEAAAPAISSRDLFGDQSVIHIRHEGTTYVLRQTRNGKLILTK